MAIRSHILIVLTLSGFLKYQTAQGHNIHQQMSVYSDSRGIDRNRLKLDGGLKFNHSSSLLTSSTFDISATRDSTFDPNVESPAEGEEIAQRTQNHAATVTLGQTWKKLTDTRVLGRVSGDENTRSQTFGGGLSHWFWGDSLQASLDVSRTRTQRPEIEVLDANSDVTVTPANYSSVGTVASLKHLATPTTITQYTVAHVEANDRPPADTYAFNVRQFIPPVGAAVHGTVARAFNRGRVTTESTYGQVDAWIYEVALLKTFFKKTHARLAWREYREEEDTRVDGNQYFTGTDLVTVNLAQEIPAKTIDSIRYPMLIEAGHSRYRTNAIDRDNTRVAAVSYELGVGARF